LVQPRKIQNQERNGADFSQLSSRRCQRSNAGDTSAAAGDTSAAAGDIRLLAQQQKIPAQQHACQHVTKDEYCINTVDRKILNNQTID
jgi:hypothetical protein